MTMPKRFRAILIKDDKTEGTAVVMPFDVQREFGTRGRVPVRGTINEFTFRSTLSPYSGIHYLPVTRPCGRVQRRKRVTRLRLY